MYFEYFLPIYQVGAKWTAKIMSWLVYRCRIFEI